MAAHAASEEALTKVEIPVADLTQGAEDSVGFSVEKTNARCCCFLN